MATHTTPAIVMATTHTKAARMDMMSSWERGAMNPKKNTAGGPKASSAAPMAVAAGIAGRATKRSALTGLALHG